LPGYEIFKYYDENGKLKDVKSDDVNAYIKEVMGEEFTAKDFRTWGGTLIATTALAKCEWDKSESKRKKTVAACVKQVAKHLGNTPAVARGSYIDPRVIDAFMTKDGLSSLHATVAKMQKTANLSREEQLVLALLEKSTN
jgi:DNA topoisomerase-1